MIVVDLVDILIALCRIKVRTKRWYIKIFWHLIDICKVNAWNLYRRHCIQYGKPKRQVLSLLSFSVDLGNAVSQANKPVLKKLGRPTKRSRAGNIETSKSKRAAIPCNEIRYDQIGRWSEPVEKKNRCRLCQAYSRTYSQAYVQSVTFLYVS